MGTLPVPFPRFSLFFRLFPSSSFPLSFTPHPCFLPHLSSPSPSPFGPHHPLVFPSSSSSSLLLQPLVFPPLRSSSPPRFGPSLLPFFPPLLLQSPTSLARPLSALLLLFTPPRPTRAFFLAPSPHFPHSFSVRLPAHFTSNSIYIASLFSPPLLKLNSVSSFPFLPFSSHPTYTTYTSILRYVLLCFFSHL